MLDRELNSTVMGLIVERIFTVEIGFGILVDGCIKIFSQKLQGLGGFQI